MQSNYRVFLVDSSENPPRVVTKLPGHPKTPEEALRMGLIAVKTFVLNLDLEDEFVSVFMINKKVDIGIGKTDGVWIKVEEIPFGSFVEGAALAEDTIGPTFRNTKDFGNDITIDGEKIYLLSSIVEE